LLAALLFLPLLSFLFSALLLRPLPLLLLLAALLLLLLLLQPLLLGAALLFLFLLSFLFSALLLRPLPLLLLLAALLLLLLPLQSLLLGAALLLLLLPLQSLLLGAALLFLLSFLFSALLLTLLLLLSTLSLVAPFTRCRFAVFPLRLHTLLFLPFPFQAFTFQALPLRPVVRALFNIQSPGAFAVIAALHLIEIFGVLAVVIGFIVIRGGLINPYAAGCRQGQNQESDNH